MPTGKPKPKQIKDRDSKILEPNVFLETQKKHRDWYDANQMGKQRGMPRIAPKENRKPKGMRKHSLRKGK